MPRPKQLDRYPESYYDLFERAYRAPIRIPTSSASAAANLRSELYTFRRVLRANVTEGKTRREVALIADDLQFKVEDKDLVVSRRPLARGRLVERILDSTQTQTQEEKESAYSTDSVSTA